MLKSSACFLLFCCLLCGMQCDQPPGSLSARAYVQNWPGLRELYHNLREAGQLTIVYGAQQERYAERYRRLCTQLAGKDNRRFSINLQSDTELNDSEIGEKIILAVGTPGSNSIVNRLLDKLPLSINETELRFNGRQFKDEDTVFSLGFYPNPFNRKLPVLLITGLSDEAVLQQLAQIQERRRSIWRWSNWGYAVHQKGRSVLLGAFDDQTWRPDPQLTFNFSAKDKLLHTTAHYRFFARHSQPDPEAVAKLVENSEQAARDIEAFCGKGIGDTRIDHYLYSSSEDKGLILHNTDQAHVDFSESSVHTILNNIYEEHFTGAENLLLLRQLLGRPPTLALEKGLAVRFTPNWQKDGYKYWAKQLSRAGNLLPLKELLDNEAFQRNAELLTSCQAASFVDYLIDTYGRETFLNNYNSWQALEGEIPRLEEEWHTYLLSKSVRNVRQTQPQPLPYLRGFTLAHEGYQIYNGYASRMARRSLEQLEGLHVNAAAIVPYSFTRDPKAPNFIPVAEGPGSENNESVIHALYAAREKGMVPMLKPQIWVGGGSWPGDVEMQSEADWEQWFDYYGRWISHYAMLAEMHEIPLFCIGTELGKTTLQQPGKWRQLIRQIRKIYSGKITYAANWGEEFEKVSFWKELDYMGLNCYYPLSADSSATQAELEAGFRDIGRRVKAVVDREQKPMLLTEIGFSSVAAPWMSPHRDGYERPYNEADQRLCYEVVLEQISQHTDWCRGLFWWKWPTEIDHRGREGGKGFTPNGKAAAEVVQQYYGQMKAEEKN